MLKNLLLLILLAVVGVHGFFYLAYGSVDPCKAAAVRTVNKQQSDVARGIGTMLSGPLESAIRSEGIDACYRVALLGESPSITLGEQRPATRY